jgi:hypothetical protein
MKVPDVIEQTIVKNYTVIPDVEMISFINKPEIIKFNIFTSNLKYDDELMDKLLDVEIRLLDQFPDIPLYFRYFTYYSDTIIFNDEKVIFKK